MDSSDLKEDLSHYWPPPRKPPSRPPPDQDTIFYRSGPHALNQVRPPTRLSALKADYVYERIEAEVLVEGIDLLFDLGVEDELCPIVESRLAWWHPMRPKGFHQRAGCGKIRVNPAEETE